MAPPAFDAESGTLHARSHRRLLLRMGVAVVIALPLLGVAWHAAPRLGDAPPFEGRASDGTATTDSRDELVAHLAHNPRDARALIFLARLEFSQDRFAEAANAYRKAIDANAKVEGDPGIWCEYADAIGMTQGGSLAGQPREIVKRTLVRYPTFPRALEMAGSAAFAAHEYAEAGRNWRLLAAQWPEDTPKRRELLAAVARAEILAANGSP